MAEQIQKDTVNLEIHFMEALNEMKVVLNALFSSLNVHIPKPTALNVQFFEKNALIISLIILTLTLAFLIAFALYKIPAIEEFEEIGRFICFGCFVTIWTFILIRGLKIGNFDLENVTIKSLMFRAQITVFLITLIWLFIAFLFQIVIQMKNEIDTYAEILFLFMASCTSLIIFYKEPHFFGLATALIILLGSIGIVNYFHFEIKTCCFGIQKIIRTIQMHFSGIFIFLLVTATFHFLQMNLLKIALFGNETNLVECFTSRNSKILIFNFTFVFLLSWSYRILMEINTIFVTILVYHSLQNYYISPFKFLNLMVKPVYESLAYSVIGSFFDCFRIVLFTTEKFFPISQNFFQSLIYKSLGDVVGFSSECFDSYRQIKIAVVDQDKHESDIVKNYADFYSFHSLDFIKPYFKTIPILFLTILYFTLKESIPIGLVNYCFIFYIVSLAILQLIYLLPVIGFLNKKFLNYSRIENKKSTKYDLITNVLSFPFKFKIKTIPYVMT